MKTDREANHSSNPRAHTRSHQESDGRVRRAVTGYTRIVWSRLPLLMFIAAMIIASFAYGGLVGRYQLFPFQIISDGLKTLRTLRDTTGTADVGQFERFVDGGGIEQPASEEEIWQPRDDGGFRKLFSDLRPESAAANRIEFLDGDSLHEPLLWYGGRFQFMDLCPEWGCLAVQFGIDGEAEHAYPLRPDALEQAANDASTDEFPFELAPTFSFVRDIYPFGMSQYPNGDLLVVFHTENYTSFPAGRGVARIDRNGYPVWFRQDYSHHWPWIEEDGSALVPGRSIVDESISVPIERGSPIVLECSTGAYLDSVNVIDGDGRILESIDLTGAMLDSQFAPILVDASNPRGTRPRIPCDPLHLNYIHRIVDDVQGVWGMSSGDLVVSMRAVSAFAILDGESGRVKRLVRGSFRYQHSVHHLEDSRFLMFDNQGSDGVYGPSRLLMVDLADGRETTIFPNESTPESLRGLFSSIIGKIDISPDRSRAMVAFTREGVAVEVRLSDGAALNVFRSLHDVSSLDQFSEENATRPALFLIQGLDYVHKQEGTASSQE